MSDRFIEGGEEPPSLFALKDWRLALLARALCAAKDPLARNRLLDEVSRMLG